MVEKTLSEAVRLSGLILDQIRDDAAEASVCMGGDLLAAYRSFTDAMETYTKAIHMELQMLEMEARMSSFRM